MSLDCAQAFAHVPDSCKDGNGFLLPKDLILTPQGQSFSSFADAGDESKYKEAIVADLAYVYHGIKDTEDKTAEPTFWDAPSGDSVFLFEGNIRIRYAFYMTVDQHKALRKMRGKKCNTYIGDRKGNLLGTSPDEIIFRGFASRVIDVSSLKPATADTPALSYIEIQFEDIEEFNETLHVIEPYTGTAANKWFPYNLPSKTKVYVEQVGSIAADVVTFDVKAQSRSVTNNDGNYAGDVGIQGLDVTTYTNFVFVVGGSVTAPSAMTEVSGYEGRYTATAAGIATGDTIQIVPVATDEDLYYSDATAVTS